MIKVDSGKSGLEHRAAVETRFGMLIGRADTWVRILRERELQEPSLARSTSTQVVDAAVSLENVVVWRPRLGSRCPRLAVLALVFVRRLSRLDKDRLERPSKRKNCAQRSCRLAKIATDGAEVIANQQDRHWLISTSCFRIQASQSRRKVR